MASVIREYHKNYQDKTDEELIQIIHTGDTVALDYLIEKYTDIVKMKVSKFFMIGAEKEDIIQEGMIGLYKAIKGFDSEKQNSFKTFANLCIERQLITAVKSSNRQKHMPLNSYVSLNGAAYEENEDISLIDIFNANVAEDPLDTITKKEYFELVNESIEKNLSPFEKKVLNAYSIGKSYVGISEILDAPVKSIDNAMQRIRKKALKGLLKGDE